MPHVSLSVRPPLTPPRTDGFARWSAGVAAVALVLTVPGAPAHAAGQQAGVAWTDDVVGTTSANGTVFGSNCNSQSPNLTEEADARQLITSWASTSSAAGYSFLSPAVVPAAGASGDNATITFPNTDGLTATVSRRQVTSASALNNADGNTGTPSNNAVFANSQRLQDCAPRPADLTSAPAGMTLARPVGLSGVPAGRESLWNATVIPTGNQLDAALFEFSRPVGSFGLWFGDLESRYPEAAAPGGGVLARVKLLAADGSVLAAVNITPDEAVTTDANCGGGQQNTDLLGCGNQGTRFISFVRNQPDVAKMLVIVGDDDSCTQVAGAQCDGVTEYLSWIGPMVAEPQSDLQITKTVAAPAPAVVGDPVTYTLTVKNNGPGTAKAGWSVTDVAPPGGVTGLSLSGQAAQVSCAGLTCTGLNELPAGAEVTLSATGTWTAPPGTSATNRAYVLPDPTDVPESNPAADAPPDTSADTDQTPTNNDAQATHVIPRRPAVELQKTVETRAGSGQYGEVGDYTPDQAVTFTLTLTNTGNVALQNLQVVDPEAPECATTVAGPLAPGASTSFTCTHAAGYADDTTNVATVTAAPVGGGDPVADDDDAAVRVGTVGMRVEKSVESQADSGTYGETGHYVAGQPVSFTIVVTNTGDYDLIDLDLTDPEAPSCDRTFAGPLAPGDSVTYSCIHAAGYTADTVNTVSAAATPTGVTAPELSASDDAAIDLVAPAIALDKTVETRAGSGSYDETGLYNSGQAVSFMLTATNTGDTDLTDITISDPKAPDCDRTFAGPLAPGDSITYTCTATNGFSDDTTNTASVTADPADVTSDSIGDSDTAEVRIEADDDDGNDSNGGNGGGLPDTGGPGSGWLLTAIASLFAGLGLVRRRRLS